MGTKQNRIAMLVILDILAINAGYIACLLLRFEFSYNSDIFNNFFDNYLQNIIVITAIKILVFAVFGLYNSIWKYASIDELAKIAIASFIAAFAVVFYFSMIQSSLPRSIYIMTLMTDILSIGFIRFSYRFVRGARNKVPTTFTSKPLTRVMIVGAGDTGASMIKEMKIHPEFNKVPVVAIDDNKSKQNSRIVGVKIAGGRETIGRVAEKYRVDEIIIAINTLSKKELQLITNECSKTGCKMKILPGIIDIINGSVSINELRDVDIDDLLGRDAVTLNQEEISEYIKGRIVMVTGGGGSIGSELCRQIARFNPRKIIALDIYENNVFELENQMKIKDPNLDFEIVIASVRNKLRIGQVFDKYRPHVVFHAAAHKHVPLMENNPKEAVLNNILGTQCMLEVAEEYRVEKFVLISTDKAVNPTNIMGATKRVAEMLLQDKCQKGSMTQFSAVRFGNVLGSNGSVVPIFRNQIEQGGPITVTHKDITRYFMTITEAAQLVIQAGALAAGGEIFILDMGEPVKILDLAENVIRLSGLRPYEDIEIKITGLRPGEKLYEELLLDEEGIRKTVHKKIYVGKPLEIDHLELTKQVETLAKLTEKTDEDVKEYMKTVVQNYNPL